MNARLDFNRHMPLAIRVRAPLALRTVLFADSAARESSRARVCRPLVTRRMNLKQAQTVLSDLLMKCEQENIALPQVSIDSLTLTC